MLENNKKIKEKIRFIFDDSKQQSITYAYKKGKLISKLYKDEFNNKFQKKIIYRYDAKEQLSEITYFDANNELEKKVEFLYKKGLLDATLEKTESTGVINIVKYKYEYY